VYLTKNKKAVVWTDAAGFVRREEWLLETDGSNLAAVMTFPGRCRWRCCRIT
jgi:hypothetical protein